MSIENLIQHTVDKNPVEFANVFNSLLDERIAEKIAQRKVELSQSLFKDVEGNSND